MNLAASLAPLIEQAASQSICSIVLVDGTDACRRRDRPPSHAGCCFGLIDG